MRAACWYGSGDIRVEASQAMTAVAMTYTPDLRQHAQSDFYFEQYQLTYSRLRDLMHKPQPQSQSQLQSLS